MLWIRNNSNLWDVLLMFYIKDEDISLMTLETVKELAITDDPQKKHICSHQGSWSQLNFMLLVWNETEGIASQKKKCIDSFSPNTLSDSKYPINIIVQMSYSYPRWQNYKLKSLDLSFVLFMLLLCVVLGVGCDYCYLQVHANLFLIKHKHKLEPLVEQGS